MADYVLRSEITEEKATHCVRLLSLLAVKRGHVLDAKMSRVQPDEGGIN